MPYRSRGVTVISDPKKKKKKCPPDASPTNNFSNFFLKKIVY